MKITVRDALERYARDGVPTGSFCRAVLENNLVEAFAKADQENMATLHGIVGYVYNNLPGNCWGSKEKVAAWLEKKAGERDAAKEEGKG
ncbi:unnamed protein product [marine sediment metagenome]|uniref:Uncharacterized protein n=1 Tax=marine sediment metagenome TaxID=412755 RepID=X1EZK1_9ZZZZ